MSAERPLRAPLTAALAGALLLLSPALVLAQPSEGWTPAGAPVATAPADRVFPVAVPDGQGGVYVAWQENAKIRLQRLTADGTPAAGWSAAQGREICAPSGYGGYEQSSPRAVSDGAGGLYVIWHDERNSGCTRLCLGEPKQLFVQRIGPDGARHPDWPALGVAAGSWLARMSPTPAGDRGYAGEMNTVVAPDGRGGLLIAWVEQAIRANPEPGLRVQRISAAGELLWGERGLLLCAAPGVPQFPAIAPDGAGGAFVVWQDLRDPALGSRLYVQIVSASGAARLAGNGEPATRGPERNECYPQLSAQGREGVLLVWEAGTGATAHSLYVRRLLTLDRAAWVPEVKLTATALPEGEVAVRGDPAKGAWVAWVDVRSGGRRDIYAQRLLRTGQPMPGWAEDGVAVVETASAQRARPLLAPLGGFDVFVAWRDEQAPRISLLTANGRRAPGFPAAGLALTTESPVDRGFDLVSDGEQAAIGVWDQWMSHMGLDDVRAQKVSHDQPTLRPLQGPPLGRRDPRAQLGPNRTTEFALEGFRPNPGTRPFAVAFSLPTSAAASLEMFDVSGRRLAAADVGGLGAGRHVVRLEVAGSLEPGVYVLRLTQGDRVSTVRGVVTR